MAERADIRSLGAAHAERPIAARAVQKLQLVDGDGAGLPLDLLTLARQLIELFAADLDRRVHGRKLFYGACKLPEHALQRLLCDADGVLGKRFTTRVLRVGDKTEPQTRDIFLFR